MTNKKWNKNKELFEIEWNNDSLKNSKFQNLDWSIIIEYQIFIQIDTFERGRTIYIHRKEIIVICIEINDRIHWMNMMFQRIPHNFT